MCEPATIAAITSAAVATAAWVSANAVPIALVGVAASAATSTASAVNAQKAGEAQNEVSKLNMQLQNAQVARSQDQQAEANAARAFELSRQFQQTRGAAQAGELGDRSVRAIGRSLGFQLGQDKATLQRNQEIAATQAAARLRGIQLTRTSEQIQIGDTSGAMLGLQIGTGLLKAGAQGVGLANSLGAFDAAPLAAPSEFDIQTPQISDGFTSAALTGK